MKGLIAICVATATFAVWAASSAPASGSQASTTTTGSDRASKNADNEFYHKVAASGMAEVELGKLAQEKSKSAEVKEFAAMMVKDHTAANNKLKQVAASNNVALPDDTTLMQKATKKKMEMQGADDFDTAYVKHQIEAHENTAELMRNEIDDGKDPAAKRFATETLPTVESHLALINKIAAERGIKD